MSKEDQNNESYKRGYDEARNGNIISDVIHHVVDGKTEPHEVMSDNGYQQGKIDRGLYGPKKD